MRGINVPMGTTTTAATAPTQAWTNNVFLLDSPDEVTESLSELSAPPAAEALGCPGEVVVVDEEPEFQVASRGRVNEPAVSCWTMLAEDEADEGFCDE
jgi:hypothetical protein